MAHPFDTDKLELTGDPFPIAEAVQYSPRYSVASFSVSTNGMLIYQASNSYEAPELALVDLQGKKTVSLKNMEIFVSARLSMDAKWIAMDLYHTGARNSDIWIYDINRGVNTRFTFESTVEWYPIMSPDARRIVFASNRTGKHDLYEKVSSGASYEQLLLETNIDKYPSDWSPDGNQILFHSVNDPQTKADIWILPMSGDKQPISFLKTEYSELNAVFSPDMKWIAYQSDESGKNEVYVRPFPGANAKWQVSSNGGGAPKLHRNWKEIFYLSAGKYMSVEVDGSGSTFRIGKIKEHFDQSLVGGITTRDISADGQNILLEISNFQQESVPLTLVVHWDEELKKK